MGTLADQLIHANLDTVRLDPRLCWIDAIALQSTEPLQPNGFRPDAAACSAELLEDLSGITPAFDRWLLGERTRLSELLRLIFESELQQLRETDATPEQRAALARRIIAFDATHEGASRILMRALADLGERAQALREYERCRAALRASLDVEPSSETRALHLALRTFNRGDPEKTSPSSQQQVFVPTPNRLRVGIRPFNASLFPNSENLAFSFSQEVASALARFRWFDVIAPESLARTDFSGATDSTLPGKQLDYVVDGDVSCSCEKFQVNARLLDLAHDARLVWSDRFELAVNASEKLNALVAGPIAARIDPIIFFIEGQQERPLRFGATSLAARAVSLMYGLERESYEEAGRLLSRAAALDPQNIKAAAWKAYWHVWHIGQGWAQNPTHSLEAAHEAGLHAIRVDPENAEALGIYAHICAFLSKDFDSALHYFDRALRLNPNLAFIWALSAATQCYVGMPDTALTHLNRYRDLTPFDPYFNRWESMFTIVYVFKGDYEKAISVGRRSVRANPEFSNGYKPLIAALGHLGRRDEATPYIQKLRSLEPHFTVEKFSKVYPFRYARDREHYMQGLLLAGLPAA